QITCPHAQETRAWTCGEENLAMALSWASPTTPHQPRRVPTPEVREPLSSPGSLTPLVPAAARTSAAGVLDDDGLVDVVKRRLVLGPCAARGGCGACGTTQDTSPRAGSTARRIILRAVCL